MPHFRTKPPPLRHPAAKFQSSIPAPQESSHFRSANAVFCRPSAPWFGSWATIPSQRCTAAWLHVQLQFGFNIRWHHLPFSFIFPLVLLLLKEKERKCSWVHSSVLHRCQNYMQVHTNSSSFLIQSKIPDCQPFPLHCWEAIWCPSSVRSLPRQVYVRIRSAARFHTRILETECAVSNKVRNMQICVATVLRSWFHLDSETAGPFRTCLAKLDTHEAMLTHDQSAEFTSIGRGVQSINVIILHKHRWFSHFKPSFKKEFSQQATFWKNRRVILPCHKSYNVKLATTPHITLS